MSVVARVRTHQAVSEYLNTQPVGTRTFRALISVIAEPHRRLTVVMLTQKVTSSAP